MALIDRSAAAHFDIPHEPGETLQLRQLARGEKRLAQIPGFEIESENPPVTIGLLEAQMERDFNQDEIAGLVEAEAYNWDTLLTAAVVGWSYDKECTPSNIVLLDDATQRFAVLTILGLSRTTRAEGEAGSANSKNGSRENRESRSPAISSISPSADTGESLPLS